MFTELNPDYIEAAQGTHGYNYWLISFTDKGRKRITSTQKTITGWNTVQKQRGALHLVVHVQDRTTNEPGLSSCSLGEGYKTHFVYKIIEQARLSGDASYIRWDAPASDCTIINSSKRGNKDKGAASSTAIASDNNTQKRHLEDAVDEPPAKLQRLTVQPEVSEVEESGAEDAQNTSVAGTMTNVSGDKHEKDMGTLQETIKNLLEQLHAAKCSAHDEQTKMETRVYGLEQKLAEMAQNSAELAQEAAEMKQKLVEMAQKEVEMAQEAAEMKQEAAEMKQEAAEMTQKAAAMEQKAAEMETRVYGLERTNTHLKCAYQIKLRNTHLDARRDAAVISENNEHLRHKNNSQAYIIAKLNEEKDKLNHNLINFFMS